MAAQAASKKTSVYLQSVPVVPERFIFADNKEKGELMIPGYKKKLIAW